jgi:FlgD Ig-like domain/Fibronectin type III domain
MLDRICGSALLNSQAGTSNRPMVGLTICAKVERRLDMADEPESESFPVGKLWSLSSSLVWRLALVWLLFCSLNMNVNAATTSFTFTLDEPCNTSAGVYLPDGTLVRTLWRKVRYYSAGTYTSNWDGLDDNGNAVAPGTYQIRLLENNVQYVWDGAIGNTSAALSGPTVHRGFWFIKDMTITGTNAFYVSSYNEGQYGFRSFVTTDPQHVKSQWFWNINQFGQLVSAPGLANRNWLFATADTNRVYFACDSTFDPNTSAAYGGPGCIVACSANVLTNDGYFPDAYAPAYFTDGTVITNGSGSSFPNGIYVGTQPGLSGLAVQANGNILAAAVAPDNKIYLFDKVSGAPLGSINVNDPGRMSFSQNGSLWVTTSRAVICYTNVNARPSVATTITAGLVMPLAVAANSTNTDLVLVADGGSSQQIKAFDARGTPLWTYGLAGGYQFNGPAVATNKFWFYNDDGQTAETFITFAPDGTFWVGDGGNYRVMHFSVPGNYLEQIMYQPHSYQISVDQTDPSRVFNQFLEFHVDYNEPLQSSWVLKNNWQATLTPNYTFDAYGLYDVTTLTNGRTYALVANTNYQFAPYEICELTTNGLRFTGEIPELTNEPSEGHTWVSFAANGSIMKVAMGSPIWYEAALEGFDSSNDPIYGPDTLLATAPDGSNDPVPRCCSGTIGSPITSNKVLISFDSTLNNGYHLGGIRLGTANWLWKASPSGNLNGLGNYEISNSVTYAGDSVQALDGNVIYGYHGEFFRGEGQAGQYMHYYDDGLFIGQFGEASPGHSPWEGAIPGFAGNGHWPTLVKTNDCYYVWNNDESTHGPQRWCLVNASNIREQMGSGLLGGNAALTNPPSSFPIGVTGEPGNQLAALSWLPVANASSYRIYCSLMNGGPYENLVGQSSDTNCFISGLTNGQTYYFTVTALTDGTESIPSEQVAVTPFDTSQTVLCAGTLDEGSQEQMVVDVNSNAPAQGYPSYIGNEHLTGMLSLDDLCNYGFGHLMNLDVGTKGYALFDWGGPGSNLVQVLPPFTVTVGSGWKDGNYTKREYRICGTENPVESGFPPTDGVLGTNQALVANPVGTINIGVSDTSFHFLTVVSPEISDGHRGYTITLSSTNGASANYDVNESPGWTHTFQFLFRGNVTLTVDDYTNAGNATVQAIFLDNAAVSASTSVSPPTDVRVVSTNAN